ncbi:Hypothetical predicted protein, partial [Marmota monax]
TSGSATLQPQDLNAAPTCRETTRDTLMQRSTLEMQQQNKDHQHSYQEDPRLLQTHSYPHTGSAGPGWSPHTKGSCGGKLSVTQAPGPGWCPKMGVTICKQRGSLPRSSPLGCGSSHSGSGCWQQAAVNSSSGCSGSCYCSCGGRVTRLSLVVSSSDGFNCI